MKIKSITEFLHLTNELDNLYVARPRIEMQDGFTFSVQAGEFMHSTIKLNPFSRDGEYSHVEIGFPNRLENLIINYAEDCSSPTQTVYNWVPINIVDKVISKHGGITNSDEIINYTIDKIIEYSQLIDTYRNIRK